jgi:hypothetical protein
MRKRLGLAMTLVALAMALALPSSTMASGGYSYKTVYNYCYGDQVNLKMKNIAAGYTPATRLTIASWAQRKLSSGWQTVYTWNTAVYSFSANGAKHTLTAYRQYNGNSAYYFRILMQLQAWKGGNLLASSTFKSVKC